MQVHIGRCYGKTVEYGVTLKLKEGEKPLQIGRMCHQNVFVNKKRKRQCGSRVTRAFPFILSCTLKTVSTLNKG